MSFATTAASRVEAAWTALDAVPDPEVPVLSVRDLGIVREVLEHGDGPIKVVLTPTYSGCPATEVIAESVREAVAAAGLGPVTVTQRLAPAWTTDWISPEGRASCWPTASHHPAAALPWQVTARCASVRPAWPARAAAAPIPNVSSAFGSTAGKALHRCLACREPFESFKPI